MNKYGGGVPLKHDIWPTWKMSDILPETKTATMKIRPDEFLGGGFDTSNSTHDFASGLLCHSIGHSLENSAVGGVLQVGLIGHAGLQTSPRAVGSAANLSG